MAAAAILDFLNSWIFIYSRYLEGTVASLYQIFVKIGRSVVEIIAIFRFLKMAASAILDFWNLVILLVITVKRVETHLHAKFCQNRSIGCEDIKILDVSKWRPPPSWIFKFVKFYWLTVSGGPRHVTVPISSQSVVTLRRYCAFLNFSRWRPSAILDLFGAYLDHLQWVFVGLYHSAKFGYDRCSSFYNMNISIFGPFGWKMPIYAPKIGVFGQFDPINGLQYQQKPKRHILAWVCVIWAIKRVILENGLTCQCVSLKRGINKKHFGLYFTYVPRSPPWTNFRQILHSCRSRGCNHSWQIF